MKKIVLILLLLLFPFIAEGALEFVTGNSTYVECGVTNIPTGKSNWTLVVQTKTSVSQGQYALSAGTDSTGQAMAIGISNDTAFATIHTYISVASSTGYADGEEHHIVATSKLSGSTNTVKLYADGVYIGSQATNNQNIIMGEVFIGAFPDSPGVRRLYDGVVSDARIYNRVLSLAEIKILYQSKGSDNITNGLVGHWLMNEKPDGETATAASSVIDISKEGNHGTPINSPTYRASALKTKKLIIHH